MGVIVQRDSISSYSSPFNLGHKALAELFDGTVVVQEKVDGSQFSFTRRGSAIIYRSRNQEVDPLNAGMFARGIEAMQDILPDLTDGWTYRGEYLQKPRHNTLSYERVPLRHVIIFDIDRGDQDYLTMEEVHNECERLGFEMVPHWFCYNTPDMEQVDEWLKVTSVLGGEREGVVFKNYAKIDLHSKKTLMGKYVSDSFKETHNKSWKDRNPGKSHVVTLIIESLRTEARWMKAVQHLREAGQLENSPRDIGLLLKEVGTDILKDNEAEIKERLFKALWKDIQKGVTKGLPEWYKRLLAEEAFDV